MFARKAKWVKDLPDSDTNKDLLLRILESQKKPINFPRKVTFAIKQFPDERAARAASENYLEKERWVTSIGADLEEGGFWLEAEKDNYVLSRQGLLHDEGLFMRVASLYGAIYDGWYTQAIE